MAHYRTKNVLKMDVYALIATEQQDRKAALRWNEANVLRQGGLSQWACSFTIPEKKPLLVKRENTA